MAVEPYTIAAFVVSAASIVTASAATFAAQYTRQAARKADKSLRVLTGEQGVEDSGLVEDVAEHRRALLAAGIYPPDRFRQERGDELTERVEDREIAD